MAFLLFAFSVPVIPSEEVWYEEVYLTATTSKQYQFTYSAVVAQHPIILVGYGSRWLDEVCVSSKAIDWSKVGENSAFSFGGRLYYADSLGVVQFMLTLQDNLMIAPLSINEKDVTTIWPEHLTYRVTFACTLTSRTATESFIFTQEWESRTRYTLEDRLELKPAKYIPKNQFVIGEVELRVVSDFAMTPIYYKYATTVTETVQKTRLRHITLIQYLLRILGRTSE
jgi:hypothetical protein